MTRKPATPTTQIQFAPLDRLRLDPKNPRLGRATTERALSQEDILVRMQDWTLEELATSFCESGFWAQEALIAIHEEIDGREELVVVEGNRRLAALMMLSRVRAAGSPKKWRDIAAGVSDERLDELKTAIPYILKNSRDEVRSYLGFRHVTGIKEWSPAEKAQFISELIERDGLTYEQVRRRIGSKLPTVRQNYISYKLLLQMEGEDGIDIDRVEQRFSVLYLSIRTNGVQKYLDIKIETDTESAKKPVPDERLEQLANFARWLFGDSKRGPLFTDSRYVDEFGHVLESPQAVEYLERNPTPSFEVARRMSGVSEDEIARHIETAADEVEEALKAVHHHKKSARVASASLRIAKDIAALARNFPSVLDALKKEIE